MTSRTILIRFVDLNSLYWASEFGYSMLMKKSKSSITTVSATGASGAITGDNSHISDSAAVENIQNNSSGTSPSNNNGVVVEVSPQAISIAEVLDQIVLSCCILLSESLPPSKVVYI